MGGIKRKQSEVADVRNVDSSRKRRMEQPDSTLANLYNDLADEVQLVRLKAAGELVKHLSAQAPDRADKVDNALTRLVKGLCSGRKAARLGFSVALCELLPVAAKVETDGRFGLSAVTAKVVELTRAEGKTGGQEKREYLLGRRFALQAVLQSNIWETALARDWLLFIDAIVDLGVTKDWLRTETGAMLYEYLESESGAKLGKDRVQGLVEKLRDRRLVKTAEGVALWMSILARWPEALPKGIWHEKDPLSSDERVYLKKLLLGNMTASDKEDSKQRRGTRQSHPNFAWKAVLQQLYSRESSKDFERFWEDIVAHGLFDKSASTERKALGFQVVSLAVESAPADMLALVLSKDTTHNIISQRSGAGQYLFDAAKQPLDRLLARASRQAKTEPQVASIAISALLAGGAFDEQTKTKTLETLWQEVDVAALDHLLLSLRRYILKPIVETSNQVDRWRQRYGWQLQYLVKAHRTPEQLLAGSAGPGEGKLAPWFDNALQLLIDISYCESEPPMSDAVRTCYRTRLMACLGLITETVPDMINVIVARICEILATSRGSLSQPLSKQAADAVKNAQRSLKKIASQENDAPARAYGLLFRTLILQLYGDEPDSVAALSDLHSAFQRGDASTSIVEFLLCLLSQQSNAVRRVVEQVFRTFTSDVPSEGLQSLFDVITEKEGGGGRSVLFDRQDRDGDVTVDSGNEDEDVEAIEVSDVSDVELVNGTEVNGGTEDSDDENESASDVSDDVGESEETAFDRKLAGALGTVGMEGDSDDDGSDMDDDQMEGIDDHLANILKERKKLTSNKKELRLGKKALVDLKSRVLDLLMLYMKSQYANVLSLDCISPLLICNRTTRSKVVADKAMTVLETLFRTCTKNKVLPKPDNTNACFELLSAVHEEIKKGMSKAHAHGCSRASLFLAKILMTANKDHHLRVGSMYLQLLDEWRRDPSAKWQGFVFTEWMSWELNTKQR